MIALSPITDRLTAAGMRHVSGALEFAGLTRPPAKLPAYFVVPQNERAGKNELVNGISQKIEIEFAVIIVIDAAGRNQDGIREDLKERIDAVCDALLGWAHPEAIGPTYYSGGQLLAAGGSVLAWQTRFRTATRKRKI